MGEERSFTLTVGLSSPPTQVNSSRNPSPTHSNSASDNPQAPDSSTEPKPNNEKYKKHKKTSRPSDDHLWFTRSHVYMSGKRRVSPVDETVGNKRNKNEKITNTNQACDEGYEGEYNEEYNEEHMQAQSSSGNPPLHPESFDASKEYEERGYAADSNSSNSNSNDDDSNTNSNDSSGSDSDSDDEY
jgi:hypothetical protein